MKFHKGDKKGKKEEKHLSYPLYDFKLLSFPSSWFNVFTVQSKQNFVKLLSCLPLWFKSLSATSRFSAIAVLN